MSKVTFKNPELFGQSNTSSISRQVTDVKEWTVMVYMAGDNNLSENMAFALESLSQFTASLSEAERADLNLLAYFDGASMTAPTLYLDYSDAKPDGRPFRQPVVPNLQFHRATENTEYPQTQTEFVGPVSENSGSGAAILNFVRWCTAPPSENGRGRKARNYALILSGHSLGFHGKTFLCDESSGQHFTLSSFRRTLEQVNDLYLKDSDGGRIAILGFDSCLMSMLEVGYELKDVASTIVGSEGNLPNSGWGYAPMLSEFVSTLAKNKSKDEGIQYAGSGIGIRDAARSLVRSFTEFHKDLAIGGRSIDISAWDLNRVGPLTDAINRLGAKLQYLLTTSVDNSGKTSLFNELKKILLQSHYDSQTYMEDQCIDIKDFCQRLSMECEMASSGTFKREMLKIRDLCNEVVAEVDMCVLGCGYSGDAYQFSTGISLFFPWSILALSLADFRYRMTRFVRGRGNRDIRQPLGPGRDWYGFLQTYVGDITLRRSRAVSKVSDTEVMFYDNIDHSPGLSSELSSKNCAPWTRNVAPWSRNCAPWARNYAQETEGNLLWNRGEAGNCLNHFGRFKNFEMGWDIAGFADDPSDRYSMEK